MGSDNNNKPGPEPRHPTVAASDAFMAACCFYTARTAWAAGVSTSALGALSVGTACSAGVLRFGIAPEMFRAYNENFAMFAGRVGIPLLGLGFGRASPAVSSLLPSGDLVVLFALASGFVLSLAWSNDGAGELYTTMMGVLGMACILSSSWPADLPGVVGVLLFVAGGLAIGADRDRYIWGIRRENLFHYVLGTSIALFSSTSVLSPNQ